MFYRQNLYAEIRESAPAQRSCLTLDEKSDKTVSRLVFAPSGDDETDHLYQLNVLWLNPNNPETFPSGLIEALALHHEQYVRAATAGETIQERLRKQMEADTLSTPTERDIEVEEDEDSGVRMTVPVNSDKDKKQAIELHQEYDPDFLEEAVQFLRLQVSWDLFFV